MARKKSKKAQKAEAARMEAKRREVFNCPDCEGYGLDAAGKVCANCRGKGKV